MVLVQKYKVGLSILSFIGLLFFNSCTKEDNNEVDSEKNEDDGEILECESVFFLSVDSLECLVNIEEELDVQSIYEEEVIETTRYIKVNNIPPHYVGEFPTMGNPNSISEIENNYQMTTEPVLSTLQTSTELWISGILFNGVGLEIQTIETFINPETGQANENWNIVALQHEENLGLDCNNSHVQPSGQYHTHGLPVAYADYLGIDGTEMVKIGYAADGFPIYYKYAYNDEGILTIFESGYSLKEGDRGGDGIIAPDGCYNGLYEQDYEFIGGTGLDECNGRTGKTPESDNEYYYLFTENWPSAPICFSGTPNQSFRIR